MSTPAKSKGNPWFAVSLALMGVIVGYGLGSVQGSPFLGALPTQVAQQPIVPGAPAPEPTNDTPPTIDDDAVLGNTDAPVTIVEFTDYQCPFCGRHFSQTFPEIKKNYIDTGKVQYVVRDYPLSFHPNAQKAAEATECAGDQGKFWEMHDTLFTKGEEWGNASDASATFKGYAGDLGLNAATFATCLDNGTHAEEVAKDLADGSAAGISGTPGFWILGPDGQTEKISGAFPYASFQAAFDKML